MGADGSYSPAGTFDERLTLMLQQFSCLEERHGSERAIVLFRKMAHWYLKGMRILKRLRGDFQQVRTREEMDAAIAAIREAGPIDGIVPEYSPMWKFRCLMVLSTNGDQEGSAQYGRLLPYCAVPRGDEAVNFLVQN